MSTIQELPCQEIVELVTEYLEGTMEAELRDAFDRHLVKCINCSNYLEQMEGAIRLSGTIRPEALSPEFQAGLIEAFRDFMRP